MMKIFPCWLENVVSNFGNNNRTNYYNLNFTRSQIKLKWVKALFVIWRNIGVSYPIIIIHLESNYSPAF